MRKMFFASPVDQDQIKKFISDFDWNSTVVSHQKSIFRDQKSFSDQKKMQKPDTPTPLHIVLEQWTSENYLELFKFAIETCKKEIMEQILLQKHSRVSHVIICQLSLGFSR